MKLEARKLIAPVATRAVNIALEIARNASSVGTVMAAFASIADIAGSATAQEDAALAPVVAVAIAKGEANLDDNRLVKRVFALLSVLSRRLGPRLIPFIKKFTAFTVAVASRMLKLPKSRASAGASVPRPACFRLLSSVKASSLPLQSWPPLRSRSCRFSSTALRPLSRPSRLSSATTSPSCSSRSCSRRCSNRPTAAGRLRSTACSTRLPRTSRRRRSSLPSSSSGRTSTTPRPRPRSPCSTS